MTDRQDSILRERGSLAQSNNVADDLLASAAGAREEMDAQRKITGGMGSKMASLADRFPVIGTIINKISRRKQRDMVIIAAVIGVCVTFTIIYWFR